MTISDAHEIAMDYQARLKDGTVIDFTATGGMTPMSVAMKNDEFILLGKQRVRCRDVAQIRCVYFEKTR